LRSVSILTALLLVAILACVNFAVDLAEPHGSVWDESYYLTSTQRYHEGRAQFASHPPLGLMLIAAGDTLLNPNRNIDTRPLGLVKQVDGQMIPAGFSFAGVRLASGVFAVLGAMAFFALMYAITQSLFSALVFSNLFTFENAFVTQFRAAHLDAFQVAFTVVALLCFVVAVRRGKRSSPLLEAGLGAACGLAMMVKLNALILLPLCAMLIVYRAALGWAETPPARSLWVATRDAGIMATACLLTMIAVFAFHIHISAHYLDLTGVAGQKDNRFLSREYGDYLVGRRPLSANVLWNAAKDYQSFMAADFNSTPMTDPNASDPLDWPLGQGAINYRWDSDGKHTSYVQLVGNRASWIVASVAPFAVFWLLALQWLRPMETSDPARRALMVMLLLEYVAFMVLHCYLGTHRVMYLYHYFIGLLLTFAMIPLAFQEIMQRWPRLRRRETPALAGLTALVLISFAFYAPLSYHQPLTHEQCELRNAFQHVVSCR
jgi:dolichyl-phosphate-mannose--protein O-mannosyl transferase